MTQPQVTRGPAAAKAGRTEEVLRAFHEEDEVARAYGYASFSFGPEYLLPKPVDPRIFVRESAAVAAQGVGKSGARASALARAISDSRSQAPGRSTRWISR